MTLPRVRALYEQFQQQPPVHWLAAAYLGYKPPARPDAEGTDIRDVFDVTGGAPLTADMLKMFM